MAVSWRDTRSHLQSGGWLDSQSHREVSALERDRQCLLPHGPLPCWNIDSLAPGFRISVQLWHRCWPGTLFEEQQQAVRNEARPIRIQVTVPATHLVHHVEALRQHQVQFVLGPSQRDIQKPPLLFDFFRGTGGHVRRNAAVDDVEDRHCFPLLTFGGMNGREDQIILV